MGRISLQGNMRAGMSGKPPSLPYMSGLPCAHHNGETSYVSGFRIKRSMATAAPSS
jgi:hypothetical protein